MPASTSATGPDNVPAARAVGRRRFMQGLLGLAAVVIGAVVIPPIVGSLASPKRGAGSPAGKTLAGTTVDIPVGAGRVVAAGNNPVVVVNTTTGVKAWSAICTHVSCNVTYDAKLRQIVCPCHDGRFDPENGAVMAGPPPRALPAVPVEVDGDQIFVVSS
jgi:cytochrome b6-f complex iron-sulfur subunit